MARAGTALVAAIVVATLVGLSGERVGPAQAASSEWRGKTSQDLGARVYIRPSGALKFAQVKWRASCRSGRLRKAHTGFQPPFDRASRASFKDAGRYTIKSKRRKSIFRVAISGRRQSARRFRGSFRGSIEVRDRGSGRTIDRCAPKQRITWSATR